MNGIQIRRTAKPLEAVMIDLLLCIHVLFACLFSLQMSFGAFNFGSHIPMQVYSHIYGSEFDVKQQELEHNPKPNVGGIAPHGLSGAVGI